MKTQITILMHTVIILTLAVLFFSSCSKENVSQGNVMALPDGVNQIIISPYGSEDMTFTYNEKAKIDSFVNFFQGLELADTNDSPENYTGAMTYDITFISSKGEANYTIAGSEFLKTQSGEWKSIPYEKGEEFVELLKINAPDIQAEKPLFDNSIEAVA